MTIEKVYSVYRTASLNKTAASLKGEVLERSDLKDVSTFCQRAECWSTQEIQSHNLLGALTKELASRLLVWVSPMYKYDLSYTPLGWFENTNTTEFTQEISSL